MLYTDLLQEQPLEKGFSSFLPEKIRETVGEKLEFFMKELVRSSYTEQGNDRCKA